MWQMIAIMALYASALFVSTRRKRRSIGQYLMLYFPSLRSPKACQAVERGKLNYRLITCSITQLHRHALSWKRPLHIAVNYRPQILPITLVYCDGMIMIMRLVDCPKRSATVIWLLCLVSWQLIAEFQTHWKCVTQYRIFAIFVTVEENCAPLGHYAASSGNSVV